MRLVTGSAKADRDALSAHGADECRKAGHVFALDRTGQASHVDDGWDEDVCHGSYPGNRAAG